MIPPHSGARAGECMSRVTIQGLFKKSSVSVMFYVLHSQSAMCNDRVSGTSGNLVTPSALFLFLLLFAWPDFFNRPKSSFFLLTEFLGREEKWACLGKSRDRRPTVSPVTSSPFTYPCFPNFP